MGARLTDRESVSVSLRRRRDRVAHHYYFDSHSLSSSSERELKKYFVLFLKAKNKIKNAASHSGGSKFAEVVMTITMKCSTTICIIVVVVEKIWNDTQHSCIYIYVSSLVGIKIITKHCDLYSHNKGVSDVG